MRPFFLKSTFLHLSIFLLLFGFFHLRPQNPVYWLEGPGFGYGGSGGGGGDGKKPGSGLKEEKRGQTVPQPIKDVVPEKPGKVQKETVSEKGWKVKDEPVKPEPKTDAKSKPVVPVEKGETDQKAQTNVIRKGTAVGSKVGEGEFDFGDGDGLGEGVGKGVGIGVGDGSGGGGFGFGGYLSVVRRRIFSEWLQYATIGQGKSCVVGLTISKGGAVSGIKLERTSGDTFYDNVAMRAVRNASPLPPLPPQFPKDTQRFRLEFRLLE